jgi:hypothetical protein
VTLLLPLGLALAGGLALSGLLVWIGRSLPSPDPERVLFQVPYRRWPGRYLRVVPPLGFVGLAVSLLVVLVRLFWEAGGWKAGAVGAVAAVPLALPLVAMAWTWRRLFGDPPSVTRDAVFIHGSVIPWTRVDRVRFEEHALVLEVPSARIFRRPSLPSRTYEIDADMRARMKELHASATT